MNARASVCAVAVAVTLFASQRDARADYPGCDRIGDYVTVTHCMANCCATHDQWYNALGCTEESWLEMVGLMAQAFPPLAAAGEAINETMSGAEMLAACTRHPDACGPALIQMLTSPICSLANLSAADCIADCESGRSPEPPINACIDSGQSWPSSDPNCCDDPIVGGSGPNPAYCAMPSCPFSCGALSQQPYPNCGCYCPNQCGDFQTRDDNDCGCHCNFTCEPPYTQGVDCQCIAPTDPCLGVVCDRGADDHCENGQCVCNPTNTCDKLCANGAHGSRYADDGCGNPLNCSCGCAAECGGICDPISGECPDLGCGPGSPAPDACGVCGGDGSSCACNWFDCQGTCNGGVWNDACGVCGGDGSSCACNWRDCQGTCNGGVWNDACGVCGGDGSSCACNYYDCAGTCNGGAQYDWCGVCGGDGSECGGGGGGGGGGDDDDNDDF